MSEAKTHISDRDISTRPDPKATGFKTQIFGCLMLRFLCEDQKLTLRSGYQVSLMVVVVTVCWPGR